MSAARDQRDRYEDEDEDDRYEDDEYEDDDEPEERDERPRGGELRASDAARSAMAQILALTGRKPSGVTSLRLGDDGWVAEVEVVEDRRIPSSEDMLAIYRIELDDDGEPLGYERLSQYRRGRGDRREGR
jgi:hypothetical protein